MRLLPRTKEVVERLAQPARVVAGPGSGREQIGREGGRAQRGEGVAVAGHRFRALAGVGACHALRQRPRVHQHCVHHRAEVALDRPHVIGGVVPVRLAGLGEQVQDQHAPPAAGGERGRHLAAQQAGDHAGVEASRTEHDQIRGRHRLERLRVGRYGPPQAEPVHAPAWMDSVDVEYSARRP